MWPRSIVAIVAAAAAATVLSACEDRAPEPQSVVATEYRRFRGELEALESRLHRSSESIALRKRWIVQFERRARELHGGDRFEAAATSLLLRLNLGRYADDSPTQATEGFALVASILEESPIGAGAVDLCSEISNLGTEAELADPALLLLTQIGKKTSSADVRRASALAAAQLLADAGRSPEAVVILRDFLAKDPDDPPSSSRARRMLNGLTSLRQGGVVPNVRIPLGADEELELGSLRPHWVWICVWAAGCGGCDRIREESVQLAVEVAARGVAVVDMEIRGESEARTSAHTPPLLWRTVFDREDRVVEELNLSTVPKNYVIDPAGRIRYVGNSLEEVRKALPKPDEK
jgi:hypothetical protein